MNGYPETPIQRVTETLMRRAAGQVETMCERMLTQDGTDYGVLVTTEYDLDNLQATITTALSPEVPFGQIHYRTTNRREGQA